MNNEILNQFKQSCDIFADIMANDAEYSEAVRNHSTVKENLKPLLEPNEEFRYIVGYPNYVVTSFGKVINIKTLTILKPRKQYGSGKKQDSYRTYWVALCKNGKPKNFSIHRLVAEAFLDDPDPAIINPVVDHIDHDTKNNTYTNLRWRSKSENSQDKITNRWTGYTIEELVAMRSNCKYGSAEYWALNHAISYKRKKTKDGTQSN